MDKLPEYTIVGGGLAGMLVAWELYKRDKPFVIYSDDAPASSHVAAGTWNPVTFRRMIPTWRAQEMIDAMLRVYPEVEKEVGVDLLSMIKVEKILANDQEASFWKEMANAEESKDFLEPKLHKENPIVYYVNSNLYSRSLSIDSVSEHFKLSTDYISQRMKTETGLDYKEYVNNKRVEKAKELLKLSDDKVSDIAKLCGFKSSLEFSETFKSLTGTIPNEYRNSISD